MRDWTWNRFQEAYQAIQTLAPGLARTIPRYLSRLPLPASLALIHLIVREDWRGGEEQPNLSPHFLPFLKALLRPLPEAGPAFISPMVEQWLEAFNVFDKYKVDGRGMYFQQWRTSLFHHLDPDWFLKKIEQFLLLARLVSEAGADRTENIFLELQQVPHFADFSLVDRQRGILLKTEFVAANVDPQSMKYFLDEAKGYRNRASDWCARSFEYHFVGDRVPEILQTALRDEFSEYPLKIYRRDEWDAAPVLVFKHRGEAPALSLEDFGAKAREEKFIDLLKKLFPDASEDELREGWSLWLELVARRSPVAIAVFSKLREIPAHGDSEASLFDFLLERPGALERIAQLPGSSLEALRQILRDRKEVVQNFFWLFFDTSASSSLGMILKSYATLKDLEVRNVSSSLRKLLQDARERWEDSAWSLKNSLDGWRFLGRKVPRLANSPEVKRRLTVKASLGAVTWWSQIDRRSMTRQAIVDIRGEYGDRDVLYVNKSVRDFKRWSEEKQEGLFREAEKYAGYLQQASQKKKFPQEIEYSFDCRADTRIQDRLKSIFKGLSLKVFFLRDDGEELPIFSLP